MVLKDIIVMLGCFFEYMYNLDVLLRIFSVNILTFFKSLHWGS